jgi:hypothetical protein
MNAHTVNVHNIISAPLRGQIRDCVMEEEEFEDLED